MPNIKIKIDGRGAKKGEIKFLMKNFEKFKSMMEGTTRSVVQESAKTIIQESLKYVPEQTGALKESNRYGVTRQRNKWVGFASYGGPQAPVTPTVNAPNGIVDYAFIVHEDMQPFELKSGFPKFLELGAADAFPKIKKLIGLRYKRDILKFKPDSGGVIQLHGNTDIIDSVDI